MGIIETIMRKREPAVAYRTVDGGHPAPYPDMTDEQLYNYEIAFNVPNRTFDRPPRSLATATAVPERGFGREPFIEPLRPARSRRYSAPSRDRDERPSNEDEAAVEETGMQTAPVDPDAADATSQALPEIEWEIPPRPELPPEPPLPPLDFSRPLRTVTTRHPVEIVTARARHSVYKVHAYIGDDDVFTLFTIDGRLSENGPRFLENVPQKQQLFLNVYPNPQGAQGERFLVTQHESRADADAHAAARPGRLACVDTEFDL